MKMFGLTGNMGCGKSTVAAMLAEYDDVLTIDCDQLAKGIISDPNNRSDLIDILGATVFSEKGPDYRSIAKAIFSGGTKKQLLERFVHPLVWQHVADMVSVDTSHQICVVESAIIFESRYEHRFDAVIAVTCSLAEQWRRLSVVRQMTDSEMSSRLALQLPSIEKEWRSAFVINTDGDRHELQKRVADLYHKLKTWRR